jgi:hypothetical protein
MTDAPLWLPVMILFGLLLLAYVGMWRGWRRRARRHDLPPLVEVPAVTGRRVAPLQAGARYFGTTVSGDWLDRVVANGLGARGSCRLALSRDGLDVVRPTGSFRVPAAALRGARHDQGIAGTVVPPHGVLVVTWRHGDLLLDSGFRITSAEASQARPSAAGSRFDGSVRELHTTWVQTISTIAKENA